MNSISQNSLFFEKLVEHRFISDIMTYCWHKNEKTIEIIRSEIDTNGYDLIMTYKNINRYIQLKTSESIQRNPIQINKLILEKENPCVILIVRKYDIEKSDYIFTYLFWGSDLGENSPDISQYKHAKHPKANSLGIKNIRQNTITVPTNRFEKINSIKEVFERLFKKTNLDTSSIGYNMYTIPSNQIDTNELRVIESEYLKKLVLKKDEKEDMEILCNMTKDDLVGKYFDKHGNIYYETGNQKNRFMLNIEYFKRIYK